MDAGRDIRRCANVIGCLRPVLVCVQDRGVELAEHHLGGVGDVTPGAGLLGLDRRGFRIGRRVVSEVEEPPSVGILEAGAVLDRDIDSVAPIWG